MEKQQQIEAIKAEISTIGNQLADVKRVDWTELATKRNILSVKLKKLTERITAREASGMETWNLRQFNI